MTTASNTEIIEMVGKKFHNLIVVSYNPTVEKRQAFLCKCKCGNLTLVNKSKLISGHTKSCGCLGKLNQKLMSKDVILVGETIIEPNKRFGRWTVVKFSHRDKYNKVHFECRCECGNIGTLEAYSLILGRATSCGCYNKAKWGSRFHTFVNYCKVTNDTFTDKIVL